MSNEEYVEEMRPMVEGRRIVRIEATEHEHTRWYFDDGSFFQFYTRLGQIPEGGNG